MASSLEATFYHLSKIAVAFSAISALFGVYFVLFALTIWSTFQRENPSHKRLRVVTILLFIDLCLHYIAQALTFSQARIRDQPQDEPTRWTIPLLFLGSFTVTIAGLLSDGIVAWRFYVIYDRKRWTLYFSATMVILNALLGFSGDFQYLFSYRGSTNDFNSLLQVAFRITSIWGWCMLGLNTVLTGAIIGKIILTARKVNKYGAAQDHRLPYLVVVEAIIESAAVNHFSILLYELATVAPTGHVATGFDVGYVFFCILPVFFGISQCLITVRLCVINNQTTGSRSPSKLIFARSQLRSSSDNIGASSEHSDILLPPLALVHASHGDCSMAGCMRSLLEQKRFNTGSHERTEHVV